jgi:hypothetical protein
MKPTGIFSASGAMWLLTTASGILSALNGLLQKGTPMHTAVYGGGGILLALVVTVAKLFHDKGIHIATIQQAGSDIAAQLPQISSDITKTASFIAHDAPALITAITDQDARIAQLEKNLPSLTAIESILTAASTPKVVTPTP